MALRIKAGVKVHKPVTIKGHMAQEFDEAVKCPATECGVVNWVTAESKHLFQHKSVQIECRACGGLITNDIERLTTILEAPEYIKGAHCTPHSDAKWQGYDEWINCTNTTCGATNYFTRQQLQDAKSILRWICRACGCKETVSITLRT